MQWAIYSLPFACPKQSNAIRVLRRIKARLNLLQQVWCFDVSSKETSNPRDFYTSFGKVN